jgi:hypothetical protein
MDDHPNFAQELPRKLLPTKAKETQGRRRERRQFARGCLWRVGPSGTVAHRRGRPSSLHWTICRRRDAGKDASPARPGMSFATTDLGVHDMGRGHGEDIC